MKLMYKVYKKKDLGRLWPSTLYISLFMFILMIIIAIYGYYRITVIGATVWRVLWVITGIFLFFIFGVLMIYSGRHVKAYLLVKEIKVSNGKISYITWTGKKFEINFEDIVMILAAVERAYPNGRRVKYLGGELVYYNRELGKYMRIQLPVNDMIEVVGYYREWCSKNKREECARIYEGIYAENKHYRKVMEELIERDKRRKKKINLPKPSW